MKVTDTKAPKKEETVKKVYATRQNTAISGSAIPFQKGNIKDEGTLSTLVIH